ncbi:MAG: DUF418 domain-containing protein [Chloroflexi bacterium]|nr:DUF418 domain-containing protein [Chloroflexota bacterium]
MSVSTRDSFPDILRGFALFGIALVNIPFLSIDAGMGVVGADLTRPANTSAAFWVMALFQSKFYLIFAFLFGYSSSYVLKSDIAQRRRWIMRCVGLCVLGALHGLLLFHGDILLLYGALGLLLTVLVFKSERVIRISAIVLFTISSLGLTGFALLAYAGEALLAGMGKPMPAWIIDTPLNAALASGTFLEAIAARAALLATVVPQIVLLQGPFVFVAFLVGVLAARQRGLVTPDPATMTRLGIWGLALGLPLQLLAATLFVNNAVGMNSLGMYMISQAINVIAAPLLSAGYIALLWHLSQRISLGILQAAGRLSLTGYLSQSVVFSLLFSAWGADLFGMLDLAAVTAIAAAVWLVLSLLSMAWLRIRDRGPLEHVLSGISRWGSPSA